MKDLLEKVSDDAIESEYQRRCKLDRDSMSGEFPTFNQCGKWVRNLLLPEIERLSKELDGYRDGNEKLKTTNSRLKDEIEKLRALVKKLQPRRLVDED